MEVISICGFRGGLEWVQREDYYYIMCRNRGSSKHYRCCNTGCPARWTSKGGVPGPIHGDHDHGIQTWIPERNQMFQKIKMRCIQEVTSLQSIYEEEALRHRSASSHLLYGNILPSMKKWRRSTQPAVPNSLAGYGAAVAAHAQYGALHLATVSAGGGSAVMLGMAGFAECLQESSTIVLDGTFLTVPAGLPAYQILTVHAITQGQHYHPIVVLMENRRQALYEAALQRVWHLAGMPRPETIITDYEPALQAAVESVTGIPASGCYFHFIQALIRRARQEHLAVGRNTAGGRLVRLYATLALLPPARAETALEELPHAAATMGLPLHAAFNRYFVDYWMSRIRPETFSVFGRPFRTSNTAESFHAYLRNALGASPNIWRFTQVIQQKFHTCASRRQARLAGNVVPQRRARPGSMVRQATVEGNLAALDRGTITIREFLVSTSQAIVVGAGLVVDDVPEVAEEVVLDAEESADNNHADLREANPSAAEISRSPRCGVCQDRAPTRVLIPCGHTLCDDCLTGIQASVFTDRCPFCRQQYQNEIAIFLL